MKRDELESIAAELMGRPAYVALKSEGVPEHIGGPKIAGCYSPRMDLHLQDWLTAQGRWEGRRPAIYLDDTRNSESFLFAWAIHEMAHVEDIGFSEVSAVLKNTLEAEKQLWIETRDEEPAASTGYDPEHGPRFLRAVAHLWHRSRVLGCYYDPETIYDGTLYNVPEAWVVIRALKDELERLESLPVHLILDLPSTSPVFDSIFKELAR